MVYDFAYLPTRELRPFHKNAWQHSEKSRQKEEKSRFQPGRFTKELFIERLFVSKEWCSSALKHIYVYANWELGSQHSHDFVEHHLKPQLYAQHLTSISMTMTTPDEYVTCLVCCPNLQNLVFRFEDSFFQESVEKDISSDEWIGEDFLAFEQSCQLLRQLAGIPCITFEASFRSWKYYMHSVSLQSNYKINIAIFETLAQKQSKLPRLKNWQDAESRYSPVGNMEMVSTPAAPSQDTAKRVPLRDDELPDNVEELIHLALLRGGDLLEWLRGAKEAKWELRISKQR